MYLLHIAVSLFPLPSPLSKSKINEILKKIKNNRMVFEKQKNLKKQKTRLKVIFLSIFCVIEVTPVEAESAVVEPGVKGRAAVKLKSRRSSRHLSWERGGFMFNSAMSEMQFLGAENINV